MVDLLFRQAACGEIDVGQEFVALAAAACRSARAIAPGPTSQRGSASGCSVSSSVRIETEPPALRLPAGEQLLERRREAHALELGVQRVDLAGGGGSCVRSRRCAATLSSVMPSRPISSSSVGSVVGSCGQRIELAVPHRQVRMRAAAVGAVFEAQALREPQRVHVHLPAGGAVRERRRRRRCRCSDRRRAASRRASTRRSRVRDAVLPADVVPAVDADLEAGVARRAHHVAGAPADVGPGQHGAVQQRLQAVVLHDRRAAHLAEEARPEHALDRAPGVIGAEREEERRAGAVLLQQHRRGSARLRACRAACRRRS